MKPPLKTKSKVPSKKKSVSKRLPPAIKVRTRSSVTAGRKFERLVRILEILRGPEGCPWDRAQNALKIRDFFLEEVFEAVEALEAGNDGHLAEELGDVLMEVVFLARIHEEEGRFSISAALDSIIGKMIARHPHVFGKKREMSVKGVLDAWQTNKLIEKKRSSILEDPVPSTPSLLSAFLMGKRVAGVGFDWPSVSGAMDKVREETGELDEAIRRGQKEAVAEEIGDLFFSLANVARKLGVNPEIALHKANAKFTRRFRMLEKELKASRKTLGTVSLDEMDAIWNKNKAAH